jgi:hypothetical protein
MSGSCSNNSVKLVNTNIDNTTYYTEKELREEYNQNDKCKIGVNGKVYDITEYKEGLRKYYNDIDDNDDIYLNIECGKNYYTFNESNIFKRKTYNKRNKETLYEKIKRKLKNSYIASSSNHNLRQSEKDEFLRDERGHLETLTLDELKKILNNRNIKYHNEEKENYEILINRIIHDNEIKRENYFYILLTKIIVILTLIIIYIITKNVYLLYLLTIYLAYRFYKDYKEIFFDNYNNECNNTEFNLKYHYSRFQVGKIKNYYMNNTLFYILVLIFSVFIIHFYIKTGNNYIILTIFLILLYNFIKYKEQYNIKSKISSDIEDTIDNIVIENEIVIKDNDVASGPSDSN